ncbi:MAG: DUF1565 domain-containing protein [Cyclobacteriaceae bacterium]|nr:DUF1565 domain-containing protein [Cyclobacteriaceae bacterium]
MKFKLFAFLYFLSGVFTLCNATEYHVAKTGNDLNTGSASAPFKTIQAAADIARAGDVITVHEGVYREWVNPVNGGTSDINRIVYQAAPGENVAIKGSEVVSGWQKVSKNVWKVVLGNDMFGDYNPYQQLIEGDWFLDLGRKHHTGEVYLNDKALFEVASLDQVKDPKPLENALYPEASIYQWYSESNAENTTIWANFQGADPNREHVEINVRRYVFWPAKNYVNYITVRGFTLSQAAPKWAPPTAAQDGLIGPNWSKGWIIENNTVSNSKCVGISLGKEHSTGENRWTKEKVKHGTQRQRDVVFNALKIGWSKETIGAHIVRNNTIYDCGQAGIVGHLGAIFSQIYNNHIYDITTQRQYRGYEMAGIKLHVAIDTYIHNNLIHDCWKGLWLDWQAQGVRVSKNVMYRNFQQDLFIEVSHGPHLVDNNVLLSKQAFLNAAQGSAIVNNLIGGEVMLRPVLNRFTPYHYQHSTMVAGLMTIQGGDDRYYNNIFISQKESGKLLTGTYHYDNFPVSVNEWVPGQSPDDYAKLLYPVSIASNLYLNGSKAFVRETGAVVDSSFATQVQLIENSEGVFLKFELNDSYKNVKNVQVSTEMLGEAFQPEVPFLNPDGGQIRIDTDYFNVARDQEKPAAGPFQKLEAGSNTMKLWPKQFLNVK